jgi:hypothetical protein
MQEREVLARFDQIWQRLEALIAGISENEIPVDIAAARRD